MACECEMGCCHCKPTSHAAEPSALRRALARLDHCATNDAAWFGGPHGMFVDVPVRDLQAALARLRSLEEVLTHTANMLESAVTYPTWPGAQKCVAAARAAVTASA